MLNRPSDRAVPNLPSRDLDVDELYAAIAATGVPERITGFPRLHPVALQDWGARVGYLVDPDGTQFHLIEEA